MFHNPLTITKVIGGIERILGIASQVVPLYKRVSPTISSVHNIIKQIPLKKVTPSKKVIETKQIKKENQIINSPKFFQ